MRQPPDHWRKTPMIANPFLRYALLFALFAYGIWAITMLPIDWARVSQGLTRAQRIFSGAFPPSFERSSLLIDGFLESLRIAILATVGGVLLSIPIAFMAAKILTPLPLYLPWRAIIPASRRSIGIGESHSAA